MTIARIALVQASTRDGRFSDKPTAWGSANLAARRDVEVDVIDGLAQTRQHRRRRQLSREAE